MVPRPYFCYFVQLVLQSSKESCKVLDRSASSNVGDKNVSEIAHLGHLKSATKENKFCLSVLNLMSFCGDTLL